MKYILALLTLLTLLTPSIGLSQVDMPAITTEDKYSFIELSTGPYLLFDVSDRAVIEQAYIVIDTALTYEATDSILIGLNGEFGRYKISELDSNGIYPLDLKEVVINSIITGETNYNLETGSYLTIDSLVAPSDGYYNLRYNGSITSTKIATISGGIFVNDTMVSEFKFGAYSTTLPHQVCGAASVWMSAGDEVSIKLKTDVTSTVSSTKSSQLVLERRNGYIVNDATSIYLYTGATAGRLRVYIKYRNLD